MAQKKFKPSRDSSAFSFDLWDALWGSLACLVIFIVPFVPDEKLVRVKLQVLEIGLFALLVLIGLRSTLTASLPFPLGAPVEINSEKKHVLPGAAITVAILFWVGVQAVMGLLTGEKSLMENEMRRVILGAAAFLVFSAGGLKTEWRRRFLGAWAISASLVALYGCLQATGGAWIIQVPRMERVMGTYGNPIFFGAFLLLSIFVTASLVASSKNSLMKLLLLGGSLIQGIALYHTKTRSSWIGLFAGAGLWLVVRFGVKRIPRWALLLILVSGGVFVYQTRGIWARDQGHLLIWRDTVRMWKDHPVKGVGLGAFHTIFPSYAQEDLKAKWPKGKFIVNYTHNEYLQMLAEGGVFGFLSFAAVIFLFFRSMIVALRSTPTESGVLYLSLGVAAILVQNIFSVDMRFGISFANMFMLMGVATTHLTPDDKKRIPFDDSKPAFPIRLVMTALWIIFMGMIVLPAVLKPYRAQKAVSRTPSFFDERLLDPAKSIQDLEKLAKEYPHEPSVLEKLAYVYAKEMKTRDNKINTAMAHSAIQSYETLIRIDPDRISAYNNLANINYTLGRADQAIELWRRCVQLDPKFKDAHLNLGKTLYVRGDLKEAASHFQKILEMDPGNAEAIVFLKRMVE